MDEGAHSQRKKWLTILLLVMAIGLGIFVVWRVDTEPRTDDAYVYADTINVVPEVSGRIVNLAVQMVEGALTTPGWSTGWARPRIAECAERIALRAALPPEGAVLVDDQLL